MDTSKQVIVALTAERLRTFRYFESLTDEEAERVLQEAAPVRLSAGEVLFHQGDEGHSVYLLASGSMQIRVDVPGPVDHILAELEPGAILGEIALLLDRPRGGSACAITDCELWQLTRENFQVDLAAGEPWASKLLLATAQTLAQRLDAVNQEVIRFTLSSKGAAEASAASATPATAKVAELDALRHRLFNDWAF